MTTDQQKDDLVLGAHFSISGGIDKSVDRAANLNANALQIFTHNVRSWKSKSLASEEADKFKRKRSSKGIVYSVIHTSYLLNLASPKNKLWQKSINGLIEEIDRANQLEIPHINTHVGAHTGSGVEQGLDRVIEAMNRASKSEPFRRGQVSILLENTSGSGTTLGKNLDQFATILNGLENPDRFGICFDTCHGYGGGYDIGSPEGVENTVDEIDRKIGLEKIKLVHLNDSEGELGSTVDRHVHIGEGKIGEQGFKAFINNPHLKNLPFILETPKEEIDGQPADKINLQKIIDLRDEGS